MCGAESRLFRAEVEGTVLNACRSCSKFGKIIGNVHERAFPDRRREFKRTPSISKSEITQALVEEYSSILKKKREQSGLTQEDLAKKINEKMSLIHKIETGHFEPNIKLARKLEKFFKVKILEQVENSSVSSQATKSDSFTLGDFVKIRKRM